MAEQVERRRLAAGEGEVALGDEVATASGLGHRLLEAAEPLDAGGHVHRPGHGADHGGAAVEQMPGRGGRRVRVVDVDVGETGHPRIAHEHHRTRRRSHRPGEILAVVRDDDRPVGRVRQEEGEHRVDAVLRVRHRQQHMNAGVMKGLERAVVGAGEEGVREHPVLGLGHQHHHRADPPGDQGAGGDVGPVAEHAHGLAHGIGRRTRHWHHPVDHPRRGRARHAGGPGDVVQGGCDALAHRSLLPPRRASWLICQCGWGTQSVSVRATSPYQCALAFGSRFRSGSTATSPNRFW